MAREISSGKRLLQVLESVAEASEGIGVLEVAASLGMAASTAHRMLATLSACGYVAQDHREKYRLTPKLCALAYRPYHGHNLVAVALPTLRALSEAMGESSSLAVLYDQRAVTVAGVEAPGPGGLRCPPGEIVPLHCTALGKVLLTFILGTIEGLELERFTVNTIADPELLADHLAQVRLRGLAYDLEEYTVGVRCCAVPVRDRTGAVVAALGITALAARLTNEHLAPVGAQVRTAASRVSADLGWAEMAAS